MTPTLVIAAALLYQPAPPPATATPFMIPLADNTTATAVVLPGPDNASWLVYATATGQLAYYNLSPTSPGPVPPLPPVPPVPPVPPPGRPAALIIITDEPEPFGTWTTATVQKILAAKQLTATNYAISSINDPAYDDVNGLKWIGKSAGNATPYAFLIDATGKQLWAGTAPTNDAQWAAVLNTSTRKAEDPCPTQCKPKKRGNR